MTKYRAATTNSTAAQVAPYLPDNYTVSPNASGGATIIGQDVAGWTLDGYVIPRLASGLHVATETTVPECFSPTPILSNLMNGLFR
jgi:hypothetical protein